MQQILYQNYKEDQGSFKNTLKNKEVEKAVTLHPVKDPDYQYRIYNYLRSVRIMREHQRELKMHREMALMTEELRDARFLPEPEIGLLPSMTKFRPLNSKEVIPWEFIGRSIYSQFNNNPKRGIDDSTRGGLDEVINQVIAKVNKNAHLRGRTIEFKDIQYGYKRLDPMHGPDYILDLVLTYRKYHGKKIALSVRRHAYLQQAFLPIETIEDDGFIVDTSDSNNMGARLMSWIQEKLNAVGGWSTGLVETKPGEGLVTPPPKLMPKRSEHINLIMPLMGRFDTFQRFMRNLENVVFIPRANARLVLVLYKTADDPASYHKSIDLVDAYRSKHGRHVIEVVLANSEFSRGPGLQLGAELCDVESLLFFVDVDIMFTGAALDRIRMNTRRGSQVYFPIVFSQFDPIPVCFPGSWHCDCSGPRCVLNPQDISQDAGYWRQFGFGIASMYRSDYHRVGGFDLSIRGWGKEDVDLYTKFIEHYYTIFRVVDPGMTHIFHAISCHDDLESAQMVMCINSKAQSYGSTILLANQIFRTPDIIRRLEVHYINRGS